MNSSEIFFIGPVLNDWQIVGQVELIENKKNKDEIIMLYCDYENGRCTSNIFGFSSICKQCKKNVENIKIKIFPKIKFIGIKPGKVNNNIDLTDVRYSAISTLNSNLRPVKDNWSKRQSMIFNEVNEYAENFYSQLLITLENINIKKIYFYNGRVLPSSIIVDYSRKNLVEFCGIELSGKGDEYHLTENHTVHNIDYGRRLVNSLLKNSYTNIELEKAKFFFENNIKRQNKFKNFDLTKKRKNQEKYIAIFTSSDDELSSLGESWESIFTKSLPLTIEKIVKDKKDYFFVIRIHPNQYGQGKNIIKTYNILEEKYDNLLIIYPNERINSYSIIKNSTCVISFGSTISVEATYMGKPSILLGVQQYDLSGVVYKPENFNELYNLLDLRNSIKPCNINAAIAYALYVLRPGIKFSKISGKVGYYKIRNSYLISTYSLNYLFSKFLIQFFYERRDIGIKSILRLILIKLRIYNLSKDRLI